MNTSHGDDDGNVCTGVVRRTPRWKIVAEKLTVAREMGHLGMIAASTKVAEYKLHDLAMDKGKPLTPTELAKLYEYFAVEP